MPPLSLPHTKKGAIPIYRYLVPTLVAVIAAAVLITSVPVEAGSRSKMRLGVSMTEGNRDISVMDDFRDQTGRYPAIWTVWSAWGNPEGKKFPKAMVAGIKARGSVPMIFWEPVKRQGLCTDHSRFRKIANGKFDKYIKNWARAAKRSKTVVLLRFAHEINGRYFPWTIGKCGNTIPQYKAAWKRVHNLVRNKVGAKNVKFVWTVAKKKCAGCNPYKKFYPGNRYVQYAGFSSFNWGAQKKWVTMPEGVGRIMKYFNKFTKKPVIVAELAANAVRGPAAQSFENKPQWIRTGYPAVYKKWPRIKAIMYLNEDLTSVGHPDWSLDTPSPGAMDAYTEIVNDPRFQGRY